MGTYDLQLVDQRSTDFRLAPEVGARAVLGNRAINLWDPMLSRECHD